MQICSKQTASEKTDINQVDKDGQTLVFFAAWKGHMKCVDFLVPG